MISYRSDRTLSFLEKRLDIITNIIKNMDDEDIKISYIDPDSLIDWYIGNVRNIWDDIFKYLNKINYMRMKEV